MKLYYLVAVEVDECKVLADNPVQPIADSVRNELLSALDSASGALGLVSVVVKPRADNIIRRLRNGLMYYAFHDRQVDGAWNEVDHADVFEESKEFVEYRPCAREAYEDVDRG